MKKCGVLALLSVFGIVVFGQSHISGKLVDDTTRDPLNFASVAVYWSNDSSLVSGNIS